MNKKILPILVSFLVLLIGIALFAYYKKQQEYLSAPAETFNGFLRSVKGNTLSIDEVQFLSGEEARELGAQDTGCPVEKVQDCIPSLENDFYVRNVDKAEQTYRLAGDAAISILSNPGGPNLASATPREFLSSFPRKDRLQPFLFVRKGDVIVSATEEYTP